MVCDMTGEHVQPPSSINSPCVMVCTIDEKSGLCLGCYRTMDEIAEWRRMGESNRVRLISELALRADQIDPALRG